MTLRASAIRRSEKAQRGGIFFRLLFFLFFLALLILIFLVRFPLLRLAGNFWVVNEDPQASDAILILGDDNYYGERAERAAELFKAGWAPRIVASGPYLRPYASIPELMQHDLADRGIPARAILRFAHRADNTREEAIALSQLISSHGWKRVLVVTSNYHTRRASYICERAFPAGTELRIIAARDSEYNPDEWWRARRSVKLFFRESVGMIAALWEMRQSDVQKSAFAEPDGPAAPLGGLSPACNLRVYS